jgi:penicillin-binding protein 2
MKQHFPLKTCNKKSAFTRVEFSFYIVLSYFTLICRYAYLQIIHYDDFTTASEKPYSLAASPPARGYIYDRNGVLFADNYPVFTAT